MTEVNTTDTNVQDTISNAVTPPAYPMIYGAIHQAIVDAGQIGLDKNGRNSHHDFNYRSIDDAMFVCNRLLSKNKLSIVPQVEEIRAESAADQYGKLTYVQTYKITFTVYAIDGSNIQSTYNITNPSKDPSKNVGICQSYCFKEFVLKLFCVPIAGADDLDSRDEKGLPTTAIPIPSAEVNKVGITWEQPPTKKEEVMLWAGSMLGSEDEATQLFDSIEPVNGKKGKPFMMAVRQNWESN